MKHSLKKNDDDNYYPAAMTIAGSDSCGGAGIQADLRTFSAFGVYGCSAITAITAQNPREVQRIDPLPAAAVRAQIDAVGAAFKVGAAKTGMLFNREIIEAVATALTGTNIPLVVDPVMVATSGARLLQSDAVAALKQQLLPLAAWITPNIPEAEILTDRRIVSRSDMIAAAVHCAETWRCSCIVKGGHNLTGKDRAVDIVAHEYKVYELSTPWMPSPTTAAHGTGCTLSAALAAGLSLGFEWEEGLRLAKGFVFGSLTEPVTLGDGIDAMYPPEDTYEDMVQLIKL